MVSSPTIKLAYDHSIYFLSFYWNMKVKKAKTQTKLYYISRTQLQGLITKQTLEKKGSNKTFIHPIAKDNHGSN